MDCDCQIWIVGRIPTGEVVPRQPTGCTDIKQAEAVRAAHIAHFAKEAKADAVHGPTIAEFCGREHSPLVATIPYAGNFTGRIPAFFQAIGGSTTGGKVTVDKFIAQDDTVVSIGRYTAEVRGAGAKIDTPIAHIFTVRDGKVSSWTGFSDSAAVASAHTGAAASARR